MAPEPLGSSGLPVATAILTFGRESTNKKNGQNQFDSRPQHFMPGVHLRRSGDVRHCQGVVLADWTVAGPDGKVAMSGTNVFAFGPTGLLESVVGIAAATAPTGGAVS